MNKIILALLWACMLIGCQKNQDVATTVIKANSIVCGSCAKTVQKAVSGLDGVKEVNVDLK